jgi:lambda family phage portal protein
MQFPNWLSRILPTHKAARRRFEAAQFNRLTYSWMQSAKSINTELRGDLDALRRRSRELSKNEPMAKKFLSLVGSNVIGPNGFKLQARALFGQEADTYANQAIEDAWQRWGAVGVCDVSGRMTFTDMLRNIARGTARDGEALVRELQGYNNGFGYALQILDIERLDTTFNRESANGQNAVIMGVEINSYGRPLAFHLASAQHGRDPTGRNLQRIPADEIIHVFLTDDPEQVRGVPWMHASMMRMHHLKGYEEAAIIAARIGASKMGFFTQAEGTQQQDLAAAIGDGVDSEGIPFTEAVPGEFGQLPIGVDFKAFDPDYPHDQYPEFTKAAKRDIGSGFDVAYHSLANDLEGVNFSSIRSGTLEERDNWMIIQNWLKGALLERIYPRWLDNALLSGAIVLQNGSPLPASKYQKFLPHEFLGRRWSWVDPYKDMQTNVLALNNVLDSPYNIAAQQGLDIEEVITDVARFNAALEKNNISRVKENTQIGNTTQTDKDDANEDGKANDKTST